jgi:tetratricopeptide (TPR) repeat protein
MQALGHVAGLGQDTLSRDEGVVTLRRLSLVNEHAKRLSLLPLTRSYLESEVQQMPQFVRSAYNRMFEYYRLLVQPPAEALLDCPYWDGMLNLEGAESLEKEWNNLALLIHRALNHEQYRIALDMLLPVVHFLNTWGLWDERLDLSRRMCQAARILSEPAVQDSADQAARELLDSPVAWLWIDAIGWILRQRRQFLECFEAIQKGRLIAREHGLTDALLLADAFDARLHATMGNIDSAWHSIENAWEQLDLNSVSKGGTKLRRMIASRVVSAMAKLCELDGTLDRARELHELALELHLSIGEPAATTLSRLAFIDLQRGELDSAEELFGRALHLAEPNTLARVSVGLASIAEERGEQQKAVSLYRQALEQFVQLGLDQSVRECQALLAELEDRREET